MNSVLGDVLGGVQAGEAAYAAAFMVTDREDLRVDLRYFTVDVFDCFRMAGLSVRLVAFVGHL